MTQAILVAGLLTLAVLAWLAWRELRGQTHVYKSPCRTPPEVSDEMRLVARAIREAARCCGARWWLDYGTLLGAWRISDVMAYDHDLDLSLLAEDVPLFEPARERLRAQGIEIDLARTSIFRHGRKVGDLELWYRFGAVLCRNDPAARSGFERLIRPVVDDFPVAWLEPLGEILFCGCFYPCPARTERLLRHRYLTTRLHLRLAFPHKQRCWTSATFWREAWRIWTSRSAPVMRGPAAR
jgi:hypothetical protein